MHVLQHHLLLGVAHANKMAHIKLIYPLALFYGQVVLMLGEHTRAAAAALSSRKKRTRNAFILSSPPTTAARLANFD